MAGLIAPPFTIIERFIFMGYSRIDTFISEFSTVVNDLLFWRDRAANSAFIGAVEQTLRLDEYRDKNGNSSLAIIGAPLVDIFCEATLRTGQKSVLAVPFFNTVYSLLKGIMTPVEFSCMHDDFWYYLRDTSCDATIREPGLRIFVSAFNGLSSYSKDFAGSKIVESPKHHDEDIVNALLVYTPNNCGVSCEFRLRYNNGRLLIFPKHNEDVGKIETEFLVLPEEYCRVMGDCEVLHGLLLRSVMRLTHD